MRAMPSRVIAFFLAVVLFWSGLSTIEAPSALAQPSPEHQHAIAHAGGGAATNEGSVEHHHLDDLPSQAQNDTAPETPGLLPAAPPPSFAGLPMAEPRTMTLAGTASPFLAGPLRPPCGSACAG
jgi:hypothetical protein